MEIRAYLRLQLTNITEGVKTMLKNQQGVGQIDRGRIVAGDIGEDVRVMLCNQPDPETGKFDILVEVFGVLSVAEDGELLVTSKSPDSAVTDINPKFSVEQVFDKKPGNPPVLYVFNRNTLGVV